jgi:hypothetical protein
MTTDLFCVVAMVAGTTSPFIWSDPHSKTTSAFCFSVATDRNVQDETKLHKEIASGKISFLFIMPTPYDEIPMFSPINFISLAYSAESEV